MLKSLPKIITTFFLTIFILQMICLIFLFTLPQTGQAADAKFTPQVGIGTDFQAGVPKTPNGSTKMIGEYVRAIYKYAIGIVGILAAVVLMIGGVMWIVAGGNATAIGEAKSWIGASLTGLLLALCSYFILATVNPALVDFKTSAVKTVEQIKEENSGTGRCLTAELSGTGAKKCTDNLTQDQCLGNQGDGNRWEKDKTCPKSCCAWDMHMTATAACAATIGCSGPLYNNCDDTGTITQTDCENKTDARTYMSSGQCEKRSLLSGALPVYASHCIQAQ